MAIEKTIKSVALQAQRADAVTDLALINKYTVTPLKPEEVYAFSVILADTAVDRDYEQFSPDCLKALAPLFVDKSGILDHSWSAKDQCTRIYRCEAVRASENDSHDEPLFVLRASAYIPKNAFTGEVISKIETGILKEVSVGIAAKRAKCSICGNAMGLTQCTEGHKKGERYEHGGLCVGIISEPIDAYEFSFVAVPAQRGAGVTKGSKAIANESERRKHILAENQNFINFTERENYSKMETKNISADVKNPWTIETKALTYRRHIQGAVSDAQLKTLDELSPDGHGVLPQTMANELITEPIQQNPIRSICLTTDIKSLTESRLALIAGDYNNVAAGEAAREVELLGDELVYKRNRLAVSASISDTVFYGSSTGLVTEIDRGLRSGLAGNELRRLFDETPTADFAHMSFYTDVTAVPGATTPDAIFAALQALPQAFRTNATIVMSSAD